MESLPARITKLGRSYQKMGEKIGFAAGVEFRCGASKEVNCGGSKRVEMLKTRSNNKNSRVDWLRIDKHLARGRKTASIDKDPYSHPRFNRGRPSYSPETA